MTLPPHLRWPFFAERHRDLAARLAAWAPGALGQEAGDESRTAVDERCRQHVAALGAQGFLRYSVPQADGAGAPEFDVRAIALLRERLAWHDGLADFAFAMQGLGSGAISLAGSRGAAPALPARGRGGDAHRGLRAVRAAGRLRRRGHELHARTARATATSSTAKRPGSPTAASRISTACSRAPSRRRRADGSIAARGISAFVVDADTPGLLDRAAHRRDRAASAGAAALRRLPGPRRASASAPRARGSSSRCARSTYSAPRWPPPRSASRSVRSTRRCARAARARCSAASSPTSS